MEPINIFNYEGAKVTFKHENGMLMVNATEMAKPFNVRPNDWLRTEPAKKVISAIANSTSHICVATDLVQVINGGSNPGTWLHEDVALVFAQWLSPEFYIWCNTKIKELIQTGKTTLTPNFEIPKTLSEALYLAAKQAEQIETQQKQLELQKPKVEFFDAVAESKDAIDIGTCAKVLNIGIGRNTLFEFLRKEGVLMGNNQPYQSMIDRGYFRIVEQKYARADGSTHINIKTLVYQKGLDYILKLYKEKNS